MCAESNPDQVHFFAVDVQALAISVWNFVNSPSFAVLVAFMLAWYADDIIRFKRSIRDRRQKNRLQRDLAELRYKETLLTRLHGDAYELTLYAIRQVSFACYAGSIIFVCAFLVFMVLVVLSGSGTDRVFPGGAIISGALVGRLVRLYWVTSQLRNYDSYIMDLRDDISAIEEAIRETRDST